MTYFERSLYHRNRLNCLRHNKVRSVWGLKKASIREVVAPPLFDLVPMLRDGGGIEGKQGWQSGKSNQLPPVSFGFRSRRQSHMWVEFGFDSRFWSDSRELSKRLFFHPQPTLQNPVSKCQFDVECTNTFKRVTGSSWVFCGLNNPQIRVRMRKSDWSFINITWVQWPSSRRKKIDCTHAVYTTY